MNKDILATAMTNKDYKTLYHAMRLLEAITVNMTQANCFAKMLNDKKLLEVIKELAIKEDRQKGFLASLFSTGEDFRPKAICRGLSLLQLWADITMYY
jgi:hypothetical protein